MLPHRLSMPLPSRAAAQFSALATHAFPSLRTSAADQPASSHSLDVPQHCLRSSLPTPPLVSPDRISYTRPGCTRDTSRALLPVSLATLLQPRQSCMLPTPVD